MADNPEPDHSILHSMRKRAVLIVIVVSLLGGILGGFAAVFATRNYFSLGSSRSRDVVLEESSAVVEVANELKPSVVSITVESTQMDIFGRSQTTQGAGSGTIIREDGLILTNKHVVGDANTGAKIKVILSDGREFENAQVLARDPFNDLAYVKIDAKGLKAATLGDSDQVVVGQKAIAIGNALGEFSGSVTSGIISGIGRPITAGDPGTETERLQDLFQTDAAINPGNSGGPLVNIEGQVIGINTAVADDAENIGFAIPINQAKAGISSIDKSGKLAKPYIGVRYISLSKDIAKANNLPVNFGAYIIGGNGQPAILPNSPASKAGLQEKDIIVKVDGQAIDQNHSLVTLIGKKQVGDKVKLTILRDGKEQDIEVTLEEAPTS